MPNRPQTLKIRPEHLSRLALIYVRPSTLLQVREHSGSTPASMTWSSEQRRWDGSQLASRLLTGIKASPAPLPSGATGFKSWWLKSGWAAWEPF